jgi:Protein of unknown function (DUF1488)
MAVGIECFYIRPDLRAIVDRDSLRLRKEEALPLLDVSCPSTIAASVAMPKRVYSLTHIFEGHFMNIIRRPPSVTKPRWDGSRILFEIEIAGRPVACAISRGALQELSGCHHIAFGDLLRRFADGRNRIEEIAKSIFAIRRKA